ncbi:GAF domain-containing protein [Arthrobacter antioxidans]|uniref:GAF domain-containing protein n=1 Tax=Arthrobacter antioxidans TaxID=2895818 RepID=UPI001FFE88DC|nr:GAF domain-containing protein [Arthrobacter antioxidans]
MHQVQLELMLTALSAGGFSPEQVWLRCCAMGGRLTEAQMVRFLYSDQSHADPGITDLDRDILAHSINEMFWDRDLPSCVPYVLDSMGSARTADGPSISAAAAWLLTDAEAETERLRSLTASGLLASGPAPALDALVVEARDTFDVSSASVSLIGADHQFLKASVGPLCRLLPRRESFCDEVIRTSAPLVLPDTVGDERFRHHSLVVSEPSLRFYAAYPLRGPGGWNIGTFCILDQHPHGFSAGDRRVLHTFANRAQREVWTHLPVGAALLDDADVS